jgi:hypothetical protein
MIYCKNFCVTKFPQYNNNKKKILRVSGVRDQWGEDSVVFPVELQISQKIGSQKRGLSNNKAGRISSLIEEYVT